MAGTKREIPDNELVNRQINYTIIKNLWLLRNNEDGSRMADFYDYIQIDRNKYRSIITKDKGRTPRLGEVAKDLEIVSGVPEEIYTGKKAFNVKGFIREQWEKYFEDMDSSLHAKDKQKQEEAKKNCKVFERQLRRKLQDVPLSRTIDTRLYCAYVYFVEGKKANVSDESVRMRRVLNDLKSMSFDNLERLRSAELFEYIKELEKQVEMATTIYNYKKFQKK